MTRPKSRVQLLRGLSTDQLHCRDFGHAWQPYTAALIGHAGAYEFTLTCNRCSTLRKRTVSSRGALLSSSYSYVDGYLVKGLGRLTGDDRDVLRLLSLQTVLQEGITP